MGTHPIFESDFDCLTDKSRTFLAVMGRRPARCYRYCKNKPYPKSRFCRGVQIQRSVFMIWDPRKLQFFPSQNILLWSLMNWNSSHQKLWKPPVSVLTST